MQTVIELTYTRKGERKSDKIIGHYFINNKSVIEYNGIGYPDSDYANINIVLPGYYNDIEPINSSMYAILDNKKVKILQSKPVKHLEQSVTSLVGVTVSVS